MRFVRRRSRVRMKRRWRRWGKNSKEEEEEEGKRTKAWVESSALTSSHLIPKPKSSQLTATIFP